jgi:hypothetical protein
MSERQPVTFHLDESVFKRPSWVGFLAAFVKGQSRAGERELPRPFDF